MKYITSDDKQLTLITIDLLQRCENIKNGVVNSMTVGQNGIIQGIDLFEKVLIDFNIESIDEEKIDEFKNLVDYVLINDKTMRRNINNYVHVGVNMCFMMLGYYFGLTKSSKKRVREFI